MKQRIYFRLNWRDYFKATESQFKRLKREAGVAAYQRLYKEIKECSNKRVKECLIALDPNTRTIISVPKTDYEEVLGLCQTYLEKNEDYESCAEIRDLLIKLQTKKRKPAKKQPEKLLLIKIN